MAELVDAIDSKSISSNRVPVQVRMEAPNIYYLIFDFFLLLRYILKKSVQNNISYVIIFVVMYKYAEIAQLVEQLTCNQ